MICTPKILKRALGNYCENTSGRVEIVSNIYSSHIRPTISNRKFVVPYLGKADFCHDAMRQVETEDRANRRNVKDALDCSPSRLVDMILKLLFKFCVLHMKLMKMFAYVPAYSR